MMGKSPCDMGLSWLGVLITFNDPLASPTSQATAELLCPGIIKLCLKIFEVAERFIDGFRDCSGGIAAALGLHDLPEHGVVHVASAVVAHGGANVFRNRVQIADQFFRALRLQ